MSDFKLASGVSVPSLEGIHNCYEVFKNERYTAFTINTDIDLLKQLILDFCNGIEEPCFFILELPTNENVEKELRKSDQDPLHKDVFYRDGYQKNELIKIIEKYGALLLNDGMVSFGFASHKSRDELFVSKYKITQIYTSNPDYYHELLKRLGYSFEENIKTVWDYFSQEQPGEVSCIEVDGLNIYDMAEELKKQELYFAKRRED